MRASSAKFFSIGVFGLLFFGLSRMGKASKKPTSVPTPEPETDTHIEDEIKRAEESLSSFITSPFPGVSTEAWREYVKRSQDGRLDLVSSNHNLGLYMMNPRQLEDIGFMEHVHDIGGKVYDGDWKPPLSLERYLNEADTQYKAFEAINKINYKAINARYANRLGKPLNASGQAWEKESATASGLLGIANKAGLGGLDKWVKGNRFEKTTDVYRLYNGIF